MTEFKHWIQEIDNDDIVWLGFARADASANSINNEALDELNQLLHIVTESDTHKGLVIYSCKSNGFILGADIHTFADITNVTAITDFLRKGQVVFARLADLKIPTVAMIDGLCLGGGLELALACNYRIAADSIHTRLGLPEVRLGIHPGWGGTVRLTALIGGFSALSRLILSGSIISQYSAKKLGLVDAIVPKRQLKRAASYFILHEIKPHQPSYFSILESYAWYRHCVAKIIRYQLNKRVDGTHYPAPYAALTLWEKYGGRGSYAYLKEVESVEHLSQTDTAKNLMRIFLLRERMKACAKSYKYEFYHVHVIGAGVMGGDIAAWCALRGLYVTLQDKSYESIAPSIGRADKLFKKHLHAKHLIQAARDRLIPDPIGHGIKSADVIIEAAFEQLDVKQALILAIEQHAKVDAVIATNTSSIPLDEINTVMQNPERLVGIHFFNPVAKMELIEVVQGQKTLTTVLHQAAAFVLKIGKLPLLVKSTPGFLINRVLMPYLLEAIVLLSEGYSGEQIDASLQKFGMVMGPVALMDAVGLDVCLAVAQQLVQHFGGEIPPLLQQKVAAGLLGCKTSKGFYNYKKGRAIKQKVNSVDLTIATRLITKMTDEAKLCIQEGIVADADLLDAGMIFATGFAPFRGGILKGYHLT